MRCPYCEKENELTWKRYLRSIWGKHTCSYCYGRFGFEFSLRHNVILVISWLFFFGIPEISLFMIGVPILLSMVAGFCIGLAFMFPIDRRLESKWRKTTAFSNSSKPVTWMPSKVEGLDGVTSVTVYPNRIVFDLSGGAHEIFFFDIAQWPKHKWFWRFVAKNFNWFPQWAVVGGRDWGYFRLYTNPVVIIHYEENHENLGYTDTLLFRIHDVIRSGGFQTYDFG